VGVLLVAAMVPGLVGCSTKKKEASRAAIAGWFKAAEANAARKKTTTTTTPPALVTTTIPATTSTMPPLVRLALSKAFLEAAEARRQAEQRCQQLSGGKRGC
jgi:hypothetical protein